GGPGSGDPALQSATLSVAGTALGVSQGSAHTRGGNRSLWAILSPHGTGICASRSGSAVTNRPQTGAAHPPSRPGAPPAGGLGQAPQGVLFWTIVAMTGNDTYPDQTSKALVGFRGLTYPV